MVGDAFALPTTSPSHASTIHLGRLGSARLDASITGYEQLAAQSIEGHKLVDDIADAEIVLLTQRHLISDLLPTPLWRSNAWRQARERTYVVDFSDRPWCAVPGLYTSMPSHGFRPEWQRPWLYPWIDEERFAECHLEQPDLLFSLIGSVTHPVRSQVLGLKHPRAIIIDSTVVPDPMPPGPDRYIESIRRAKFVLCPRGHGTSSFRLQEVLCAGRVPVVISDEWVPPHGPDWDACTIRVPERLAWSVATVLADNEHRYPDMANAASKTFHAWFSKEVAFDQMVSQVLQIHSGRGKAEFRPLLRADPQLAKLFGGRGKNVLMGHVPGRRRRT